MTLPVIKVDENIADEGLDKGAEKLTDERIQAVLE